MEAIGCSTAQYLEANAARGKPMLAPGGGACMKENCTHHVVLQLRVAILRDGGMCRRRMAQSAGRRKPIYECLRLTFYASHEARLGVLAQLQLRLGRRVPPTIRQPGHLAERKLWVARRLAGAQE